MFSASEIFDVAIQIEENGDSFYRQGAETVPGASLKELLLWIADEELRHREFFLTMKSSVQRGRNPLAEQMGGLFLQDAISSHAFSLDEVDFSTMRDSESILSTAIQMEEDSILFYELIGSFVEDSLAKESLQQIIDEEKKHIDLLEERRRLLGGSAPARRSA